jgi:hypothetical protein
VLIALDNIQMIITIGFEEAAAAMDSSGVPSASLFRVVRLVRLTRLIRLFRTDMFKDLMSMLQGITSGGLTLIWAIIVFFMMVYVIALVCREFFGDNEEDNVYEYFNNVPRSMFTVFRCSFGDCSAKGGVPIAEFITYAYGGGYGLGYCAFVFFITIGLFNVISAIFVDSTMSVAAEMAQKSATERLDNEHRWCGNVTTIIKELLSTPECFNERINPDRLGDNIQDVVNAEFTRGCIEEIIAEPKVKDALDALDIDSNDHKRLSDILDPDHSGTISVLELVEGLRRLRGAPRRSDVVTVDLMVRSLQERVDEVLERIVKLQNNTQQSMPILAMADKLA